MARLTGSPARRDVLLLVHPRTLRQGDCTTFHVTCVHCRVWRPSPSPHTLREVAPRLCLYWASRSPIKAAYQGISRLAYEDIRWTKRVAPLKTSCFTVCILGVLRPTRQPFICLSTPRLLPARETHRKHCVFTLNPLNISFQNFHYLRGARHVAGARCYSLLPILFYYQPPSLPHGKH